MRNSWMRRQLAALVAALAAVLALGGAPVVGLAEEPAAPQAATSQQGGDANAAGQDSGQGSDDQGQQGGAPAGDAGQDGSGQDQGTPAASEPTQDQPATGEPAEGADEQELEPAAVADATDVDGEDLADSEQEAKPASASYRAWTGSGWQGSVVDGAQAGTTGSMLQALQISVLDGEGNKASGITYRAHVQSTGWMGWVSDGATAGRANAGKRVEAIQVKLTGDLAAEYDVYYRVYVNGYGWMGWASNGAPAGSTGQAKPIEAYQVVLVKKGEAGPSSEDVQHQGAFVDGTDVSVTAHVQRLGWMNPVTGGKTAGTTGQSLRVEALRISVQNAYMGGGISYRVHVQGIGWQGVRSDGAVAGTSGQSRRVEALRISLTGELAQHYDVYYRVHVQSFGWLGWAKNGQDAGTTGMSKRVESVQIRLVPKGGSAPSNSGCVTTSPALHMGETTVGYQAQVEGSTSFQGTRKDGATAGTTGQGKAITAFKATVSNAAGAPAGGVTYQVHVANGSWTSWCSDGTPANAGAAGMDCIRVKLTGSLASFYDVYYRVHVEKLGWLDWTKNGEKAGTLEYGFQIQAVQIKLVPRNNAAPGSTAVSYLDKKYGQLLIFANARQRSVVDSAYHTPSPGRGLCAAWVTQVISNAGFGYYGGDANQLYDQWLNLTDVRQLKVGMCVGVSRHSHTRLGRIYGHIGVYIGNGLVMDNVGEIRIVPLSWWISWYGDLVPVHYGWLGGKKLG